METKILDKIDPNLKVEREQRAAIAIITAEIDGEKKILCQYNTKWKQYNLIAGKEKGKDEGKLSQTAVREICEELNVQHEDFCIQPLAIIKITQFSKRLKVNTKYEFGVFSIKFQKPFDEMSLKFEQNPDNHWFSLKEIESNNGEISTTTVEILNALRDEGIILPISFPY